jgi:chemotaxis protein methyltransferase CheR
MKMELDTDLEAIEVALLAEAIHRRYGFDFRDYSAPSLKRRIQKRMLAEHLETISALQEKILHDSSCMERLLRDLSVHTTSMFRDPMFHLLIRDRIIPHLRTYPFIRIWHAGCSTGEEVYSMAILLHEEGLYERCRIYATDINEPVLEKARSGVFPLGAMQTNTVNYLKSGGRGDFSAYYTANYDHAIFPGWLRKNIVFAQHNLVTDAPFNHFNLIVCRNVLIYFNRDLQNRVLKLFSDSLEMFGFLGLGEKESLRHTSMAANFQTVDEAEKIYRKVSE